MKKKKFALAIVASLCMLLLYGCDNIENGDIQTASVDVEICGEYYIASVRHVIENFNDYYGKTLRIEGVFFEHGFDTIYRMVKRQDFSC
jgi:hypothetical protein